MHLKNLSCISIDRQDLIRSSKIGFLINMQFSDIKVLECLRARYHAPHYILYTVISVSDYPRVIVKEIASYHDHCIVIVVIMQKLTYGPKFKHFKNLEYLVQLLDKGHNSEKLYFLSYVPF
jgi:hypothetical protein